MGNTSVFVTIKNFSSQLLLMLYFSDMISSIFNAAFQALEAGAGTHRCCAAFASLAH